MMNKKLYFPQQERMQSSPLPTVYTRRKGNGFRNQLEQQGHDEAVKQTLKEKEIAEHKLDGLLNRSKQTLYRISAVFPFDFFPDTLIIDPNKVCIITNEFFYETQIHSILYQNIRDVIVETSLLFGTLKMALEGYRTNSVSIGYLKKKEAIKARRIIDGMCTSLYEGIDIVTIDVPELAQKAEEIGRAREKFDS